MTITTTTLPTNTIEATDRTQVRVGLSEHVIRAYQEDIECGAIMPPLTVFSEQGSRRFILADGFHRLLAAVNAGKEEVDVEIHEGGMHEALLHALGANAGHGLRRTNADKVNAVKIALKDPEVSLMTDREIGDICRVHHSTVCRARTRSFMDYAEEERPQSNEGQVVEPYSPEHVRPSKPAPTQIEIDLQELHQALGLIRAFAYSGTEAYRTLGLTNEIDHINYVVDWLTEVLGEHVRCQNQRIETQ